MKPKSPTRFVTNAFLPATAAELRSNQNEISRYEQRPTPSQPRNVSRKLEPSTSTSIDAANRFMYAKKRLNRGSPCMYPIEYRWISVPTPVTKRIIVVDSGSTRKRKSTWKPPTWIHVKPSLTWCALLRARASSSAKNATSDATNVSAISPVAIQPARGSPMRLPNSSSTTAPNAGMAGITHARSRRSA